MKYKYFKVSCYNLIQQLLTFKFHKISKKYQQKICEKKKKYLRQKIKVHLLKHETLSRQNFNSKYL